MFDLLVILKGGVSAGKPITKLVRDFKRRRMREAALAEIGDGVPPLLTASEDDGVEIYQRFEKAINDGTAVMNLRLMLRILKGLSINHEQLYASDFARLQRLVADLTREEVIFLTILHKHYNARKAEDSTLMPIDIAWGDTVTELVPSVFPSESHMRAVAYGSQRTGLLFAANSIDAGGYLIPSAYMDELVELAVLDETLWKPAV
jgi:hypothetical protein